MGRSGRRGPPGLVPLSRRRLWRLRLLAAAATRRRRRRQGVKVAPFEVVHPAKVRARPPLGFVRAGGERLFFVVKNAVTLRRRTQAIGCTSCCPIPRCQRIPTRHRRRHLAIAVVAVEDFSLFAAEGQPSSRSSRDRAPPRSADSQGRTGGDCHPKAAAGAAAIVLRRRSSTGLSSDPESETVNGLSCNWRQTHILGYSEFEPYN